MLCKSATYAGAGCISVSIFSWVIQVHQGSLQRFHSACSKVTVALFSAILSVLALVLFETNPVLSLKPQSSMLCNADQTTATSKSSKFSV
jgi:hypothetical protein